VLLRGNGHDGLGMIAHWRPTGAWARRQSAGAAGQESQGGDVRLVEPEKRLIAAAADSATSHGAAA
jgi:hypothetical protein